MIFYHKRVECRMCGIIIMQCRCPGPKLVEKSLCRDCRSKELKP